MFNLNLLGKHKIFPNNICIVNLSKNLAGKNTKNIFYPDLPSICTPVPLSKSFLVPSYPELNDSEVPVSETSSASYDRKD